MQCSRAERATLAVAATLAVTCSAGVRATEGTQSAGPAQAEVAKQPPASPPALASSSADTYRIAILMSAGTAEALMASGASLYGFKAVRASNRAGVPLVWFQAQRYSLSTVVTWQAHYQAYTATHTVVPSATIDAMAAYDIAPGQVLEVQQPTGTGNVLLGGESGAISIRNQTSTPFTCGISQRQAGASAPVAAFPLYGHHLEILIPMTRVLLVFATKSLAPGTPVKVSPGLGVLIDLDGTRERSVTYDINAGWSWDGQPWAGEVRPGSDIVQLLIVSPPI